MQHISEKIQISTDGLINALVFHKGSLHLVQRGELVSQTHMGDAVLSSASLELQSMLQVLTFL